MVIVPGRKEDSKRYVTFGQVHVHSIVTGPLTRETFDKDCVAVLCSERKVTRDDIFKLFGDQWCFEYTEKEFNHDDMIWFPRGFIKVQVQG